VQLSAVPEPGQWLLLGAGLAAMGTSLRRHSR
jgi:PEP-CTERM motif